MVTEYLSGGELFEKIASEEDYNLTESECVKFLHQICEGVAYLHGKVSHRNPMIGYQICLFVKKKLNSSNEVYFKIILHCFIMIPLLHSLL